MAATTPENSHYGMGKKTLASNFYGYVFSLLLTFLSFALVWEHTFSAGTIYAGLAALAILQLIVQVIYFLRLSPRGDGMWNLMPFLFTLLVIVIIAAGSLWIMYNLNYFMMN